MIKKKVDLLDVNIYDSRDEMGKNAARDVANKINELLSEQTCVNMIFAAAPSQNEMLEYLSKSDVDFSKINAFHMDEYVGLPLDAPQRFGNYLKEHIFDKVSFKSVNYINPNNGEEELKRYTSLLNEYPIDIVCMGIGENGHIAFNDPGVADFNDPEVIKIVALDDICRNQQVNDGCFSTIDDVPTHAYTLTVPTLFKAKHLFCTVPAKTKAAAVNIMLTKEINEECPASILRRHKSSKMYLDQDSSKIYLEEN